MYFKSLLFLSRQMNFSKDQDKVVTVFHAGS